jgi:glycosyltransferase involved in cell wall biosynthesis
MKPEYSISLVIPAYNEEDSIEHSLSICDSYLQSAKVDYEIIIVNDRSMDRTGEIVDKYAGNHPYVKPIHNLCNKGSGRSLFIGLKEAKCDFIVTNFADLPFDITELHDILTLFKRENIDFVVVTRKDRKANSIYRKTTSLVNYWLIRILFGIKVADFQFVQIYKKRVLDIIDVQSRGTFVPPEIIIKALHEGFKMREYNTVFYPRVAGRAKCGNPKVILQTICEMITFWYTWMILHRRKNEVKIVLD